MSVRADPRIGTVLAGYRVDRLLGRGGMGVVYLAHDPRLDRRVALKLLVPSLADDSEFRARFLRESKLAASLDHQNVVPIFEAGEADGTLFIAMRYVEGTDLRELLREEGRLDPERTVLLLSQVADALDAAHEHGLIHRDVKPANILLAADEHVYLGDFGLTRHAEDADAGPAAGNSLGTVDYVAPEQIEGGPVDGRADVYSLGCVLYECLTGKPPYESSSTMGVLWEHLQAEPPTIRAHDDKLPDAIDPVIARALAKNPEDRQSTCHQLTDEAGSALGVTRKPRRRLTLALLMITLAIAIAGAVTAAIVVTRGNGQTAQPASVSSEPTLTPRFDSVQRIDPATNKLIATIGVGRDPGGVAAGEDAVWVTSKLESTISRIEPDSGAITKTVALGHRPFEVVIADRHVWVVDQKALLYTLDPASLALVETLTSQETGGPQFLAASDDALWATLLCLCAGGPPISPFGDIHGVIRLGFQGLSPSVKVIEVPNAEPTGIAVGQSAIWVPNDYGGLAELMRFDPESMTLVGTIRLEGGSAGIAAGASAVWVANPLDDTVSRVDPATNRVTARIDVGDTPLSIAYGDGSVWVTNRSDGTISRIDPKTNTVVATIEVGPHPDDIAVGEGGVWVTVQAR